MMKLASALYVGLLSLGLATLSSSCAEDNLSGIGESIQPNRDKVTGLATTITFDATTVATPTLYTDGTTSLLGTLIDETGSTVTGEFIKQIRTAEGVAFEDADNAQLTIDSVYFRIYSDRTEGNADAQIKVNVYKLAQPVTTLVPRARRSASTARARRSWALPPSSPALGHSSSRTPRCATSPSLWM